jgi:hypothetical protein
MVTVTIPREVTKGEELVILPRKLYEQFLRVNAIRKTAKKLDTRLKEALSDVKAGRTVGPFSTLKEGLRVLKKTS